MKLSHHGRHLNSESYKTALESQKGFSSARAVAAFESSCPGEDASLVLTLECGA